MAPRALAAPWERSWRGAEVILADLQLDLAEEAVAGIRAKGGKARAVALDVSDFVAVQRLIEQVAASAGRIDYLFNNAGITIAGETHLYEIADWTRVIDVNLGGVVHGVQAAYPIMKGQGFGHIVNTASIAGLIPLTGFMSYSATKHAVVGLSTSLRVEAAEHGVRVSVLCPGAVETPIVGGGKFGKVLQALPAQVQRKLWEKGRPISAGQFAREAVAAVGRNKAIIVIPAWWKVLWWIYRLSPTLGMAVARKFLRDTKRMIEQARVR